ncbi:unnamed protein product [Acanthosepion pharaonis]|uniref:Laccase n=1 Tax=Acanthosepion pharaonis TaxID=158019 RepID=A0A812DWH1_ACAPH|nr:unnamed protein product [Sepia pharaonis]
MVDRIMILPFGVILIVVLLLPMSATEPCDMKADVCEYKFIVAYQLTMVKGKQLLKAVNGKLYPVETVNISTATPVPEDEVITMDGYSESRLVVAINGTIPGPAIEAYIGQTVIVYVENHLYASDVTIHWHGLHQKGTPFMDGVPYVTQCPIVNGRGRFYSQPGVHNEAPLAKFTVKPGKKYRFRVIAAGALYPFEISVDGHKLQIVASDGFELEPYAADVLLINPGERFDFIITANETIGNYWIRGITTEIKKNHTFEAILHYEGAPDEEPNSSPKNCTQDDPSDTPDVDCRGDPKKNYCNDAAWTNSNWGGDNIPGIKLKRAPLKDTLIIPSGGYAVIRIKADNPGLWFMHCHIEMHSMMGMAMILNESFVDVVKAPDYFPVCRSFTPEAISRIPIVAETSTSRASESTTPSIYQKAESEEDRKIEIMTFGILIAVICVLSLVIIVLIFVLSKRRLQ